MPAKPRLVLVDAGAVIHAHRCSAWQTLCSAYDVIVPSIVVAEASFFLDESMRRVAIDIRPAIASGQLAVYAASIADFAATSKALPPQLRARVHDGELEALTWLRLNGASDTAFLTADGGAIEATVILGVSDAAMSLKLALEKCGVTKQLPYEHTEDFIAEAKRRGGVTLVQFAIPASSRKREGR